MRYILSAVALAALAFATPSRAGTITEDGQLISHGSKYTDGDAFALVYSLQPVVAPGVITSVQLSFNGYVNPGARPLTFGSVTDLTLTPHVQFGSAAVPLVDTLFPLPAPSAVGLPETLRFMNGATVGGTDQAISLTGNVAIGPGLTEMLAGKTLGAEIDMFSLITHIDGTGGVQSGTNGRDGTSGIGRLTLTVTYADPVATPEPMSLSLLGVGLLGMIAARRKIG